MSITGSRLFQRHSVFQTLFTILHHYHEEFIVLTVAMHKNPHNAWRIPLLNSDMLLLILTRNMPWVYAEKV